MILRVAMKNFMQIDPLVSSNKIFLVPISKILMREKCIKVLHDTNRCMLWINCWMEFFLRIIVAWAIEYSFLWRRNLLVILSLYFISSARPSNSAPYARQHTADYLLWPSVDEHWSLSICRTCIIFNKIIEPSLKQAAMLAAISIIVSDLFWQYLPDQIIKNHYCFECILQHNVLIKLCRDLHK